MQEQDQQHIVYREGGWVIIECVRRLRPATYNIGYQEHGDYNPDECDTCVRGLPSYDLAQQVVRTIMMAFEEGIAWCATHESPDNTNHLLGGRTIGTYHLNTFTVVAKPGRN